MLKGVGDQKVHLHNKVGHIISDVPFFGPPCISVQNFIHKAQREVLYICVSNFSAKFVDLKVLENTA